MSLKEYGYLWLLQVNPFMLTIPKWYTTNATLFKTMMNWKWFVGCLLVFFVTPSPQIHMKLLKDFFRGKPLVVICNFQLSLQFIFNLHGFCPCELLRLLHVNERHQFRIKVMSPCFDPSGFGQKLNDLWQKYLHALEGSQIFSYWFWHFTCPQHYVKPGS